MEAENHQSQATQIEKLIQEIAAFPEPQMRTKMEELLQALLEMYGEGLKRILEISASAESAGQVLIETFASDELVGALLLLHGLHPVDLEARLRKAVEDMQSAVQAQGGTLTFARLEDGVATVRLTVGGGCHGCQSSRPTLRQMVEEAIYNMAPDLDALQVEEEAAPRQGSVPVTFISPRQRKKSVSSSAIASASPGQPGSR